MLASTTYTINQLVGCHFPCRHGKRFALGRIDSITRIDGRRRLIILGLDGRAYGSWDDSTYPTEIIGHIEHTRYPNWLPNGSVVCSAAHEDMYAIYTPWTDEHIDGPFVLLHQNVVHDIASIVS